MGSSRYKFIKNKSAFIMLGRSGSGKGTQARFLVRKLRKEGVRHLETGRFLRLLIEKDNPTAVIGRKLMGRGQLFPSWLAAFTWLKEIVEKGHIDRHLVYDGAPRRVWEAELIDEVMLWYGRALPWGIYIEVSAREATRRLLLRERKDDTPKRIRNRMKFFSREVMPVIRYYKEQGRLVRVNGRLSPLTVWESIEAELDGRLKIPIRRLKN